MLNPGYRPAPISAGCVSEPQRWLVSRFQMLQCAMRDLTLWPLGRCRNVIAPDDHAPGERELLWLQHSDGHPFNLMAVTRSLGTRGKTLAIDRQRANMMTVCMHPVTGGDIREIRHPALDSQRSASTVSKKPMSTLDVRRRRSPTCR